MVSCKIVLEKENHIFLHCDCCMTEVLQVGGVKVRGLNAGPDVWFLLCHSCEWGTIGGFQKADGRTDD